MRNGMVKIAVVALLAVLWSASALAQQVRFIPDFTSMAYLQANGATQALYNGSYVLRLSRGELATAKVSETEAATAWFTLQQPVNSGFTTYFRFQIHNAEYDDGSTLPGDGLAFVVQNASSTDTTYGASGAGGIYAVGVANGGIGYSGIPNSLAIEFDTTANHWDPSINGNNHIAVQSCGTKTNGPVHIAGRFTIGTNNNVTSCLVSPAGLNNSSTLPRLGVTCGGTSCADGVPHNVVIEYAPVNNVWTLKVYIDPKFVANSHTPVAGSVPAINIPYNIDGSQNPSTGISLAPNTKTDTNSLAWVGFSASQSEQSQQQDILAWEFTPHTPTTITQTIQGCTTGPTCTPPPTTFTFGDHDTKVTYFQGFANPDGIQMTVLSTPTPRLQFYLNRLKGTSFANEQCIVYQGTGGNCIVYSITCQDKNGNPITCPVSTNQCINPTDPGCLNFSTSYYTTDGVTAGNADYLKSDPIGSNNWVSIFTGFSATTFDPRTTGSGGTPSDFVATFKVGAPPAPTPK